MPDTAIGLACGASGLVAIDCDVKNGVDGTAAWEALDIAHDGALHSRTPSGGQHILFRDSTKGEIRNSVSKIASGVDVRADGGYIIAPPSCTKAGKYVATDDWTRDPEPLPEALVHLLTSKPQRDQRPVQPRSYQGKTNAWAAAALTGELNTVRQAREGTRNNTLYCAASAIGQLVGGGELDASEVERELLSAALSTGLPEGEAQKTIESGLRAGYQQPRTRPETPIAHSDTIRATAEAATPPRFNLTDMGNAQRLISRHGNDLHYIYAWKSWLVWDGCRWREDNRGEVEQRAKDTVRGIYVEASAITDDTQRKAVVDHARRSEGCFRISAMVDLARSEPGVAILPTDLDTAPWLLNCANGTIDLRTSELYPHKRADLITKLSPVYYDPNARSPQWERFLESVTGGNAELAAFLQRAAGYTLTGDTGEEKLLFVHGPAATGKSTFLEALKAMLGDYAQTADFESFLQRRDSGGPRPDIARLAGARLVVSLEVDKGKRLAEGIIKQLTGGDTVTARELYTKAFEFRPAFKLWLAANHAPQVSAEDEAMWRRIRRVPFESVIPKGDRDPELKAILRDPAKAGPAILAWAVRGCLDWQRQGLGTCPVVDAATAALRESMDPLHDFLEECTVLSPSAWALAADLHTEYTTWCQERGETPVGTREFTTSLRTAGCEPVRKAQGRGWQGIRLLTTESEE